MKYIFTFLLTILFLSTYAQRTTGYHKGFTSINTSNVTSTGFNVSWTFDERIYVGCPTVRVVYTKLSTAGGPSASTSSANVTNCGTNININGLTPSQKYYVRIDMIINNKVIASKFQTTVTTLDP